MNSYRIVMFSTLAVIVHTAVGRAQIIFAAKQGRTEDIVAVNEEGDSRNISRHDARDLEGAVSVDGAIAFMSARDGSFDIFVCDRSGNGLQNLTGSPEYEGHPLFSPDGKWIAFRTRTDTRNEWQLRVMKLDGTGGTTLGVADRIFDVSWSPDSKTLAYAAKKGIDSFLFTVDRETKKTTEMVRTSTAGRLYSDLLSGPKSVRVKVAACEWSPDGNWIAYVRHLEVGNDQQLRIVDPKTKMDRLLVRQRYAPQDPVWSKDSNRLLYSCATELNIVIDIAKDEHSFEGGVHIFISGLTGKTRQITSGEGLHRRPVWSPDERRIAFLYEDSISSERTSLRTIDLTGGGLRTLHNNVFDGTSLQWVTE